MNIDFTSKVSFKFLSFKLAVNCRRRFDDIILTLVNLSKAII